MNLALHVAIKRSVGSNVRLAAVTGLPRERISRILHGWITPTERDREVLAAAVEESPEALFGEVRHDG